MESIDTQTYTRRAGARYLHGEWQAPEKKLGYSAASEISLIPAVSRDLPRANDSLHPLARSEVVVQSKDRRISPFSLNRSGPAVADSHEQAASHPRRPHSHETAAQLIGRRGREGKPY